MLSIFAVPQRLEALLLGMLADAALELHRFARAFDAERFVMSRSCLMSWSATAVSSANFCGRRLRPCWPRQGHVAAPCRATVADVLQGPSEVGRSKGCLRGCYPQLPQTHES